MLINWFYNLEKKIERLENHKVHMVFWHCSRLLLNILIPIYYKLNPLRADYGQGQKQGIVGLKQIGKKSSKEYTDKQVIVSLTTFPARIGKLYLVLETLFRQTVRPTRIILWLADEQFPDRKKVKVILKKYIHLGLEIKFCDDLRAHKKYFYSMKNYPGTIVITVDDDIFYPFNLVESLLDSYKKHPDCISCRRAHFMKIKKGVPVPYSKWEMRAKGHKGPDIYLCPTGCGGCLYPPGSLSNHVFDKDVLLEKCLYADDIWLKCMEYLKGTRVVLTDIDNPEIIDVIGTNKVGLAKTNVVENMNDRQMRSVSEYYGIKWEIDL